MKHNNQNSGNYVEGSWEFPKEIWKLKTLNLWNDEMVAILKYYGDKIKQSIHGIVCIQHDV